MALPQHQKFPENISMPNGSMLEAQSGLFFLLLTKWSINYVVSVLKNSIVKFILNPCAFNNGYDVENKNTRLARVYARLQTYTKLVINSLFCLGNICRIPQAGDVQ